MNRLFSVAFLCSTLVFLSCETETTAPVSVSSGLGRLRVLLTDAPATYQAVNISVSRVEVHREGADSLSGWFTINSVPGMYDLLALQNGAQVVLGDTALPPGTYSQIRLIIGSGSTVVVNGTSHELEVPSGPQTGLKLNHSFVIAPDALYELVLDFDAARSIVVTGNGRYKLKPVIRAQARQISGDLKGRIEPVAAKAHVSTMVGSDTLWAFADTTTGDFKFLALPEGVYSLQILPADTTYRDSTISGVPVVRGETTDVGTITLATK